VKQNWIRHSLNSVQKITAELYSYSQQLRHQNRRFKSHSKHGSVFTCFLIMLSGQTRNKISRPKTL
jgi:hypothetical protein